MERLGWSSGLLGFVMCRGCGRLHHLDRYRYPAPNTCMMFCHCGEDIMGYSYGWSLEEMQACKIAAEALYRDVKAMVHAP